MFEKDTGNQSQPPQEVEAFLKMRASDPNRFSGSQRLSLRTQGLIGSYGLAATQSAIEAVPTEQAIEPKPEADTTGE